MSGYRYLLQDSSLYYIYIYIYTCVCVIFFCNYVIFGEGNGNPLQYSCLENPMEGATW